MASSVTVYGLPRTGTKSLEYALSEILKIEYINKADFILTREVLPAICVEGLAILSVRNNAAEWRESVKATIMPHALQAEMHAEYVPILLRDFAGENWDSDKALGEAYNAYNARIIDAIPKERLLVFETGVGWEPLCRFLNVPIPETPYPHVNRREEWD